MIGRRIQYVLFVLGGALAGAGQAADLFEPLPAVEWSHGHAAHLLERAGFGGTPEEIGALAALGPDAAVRRLVYFDGVPSSDLPPFEHSDIFEPGLDPFTPSRPATTELASRTGRALGVDAKPAGNRRLQPIVDRFFYWLRASRLETDRVAYWWAHRMLNSSRPLQEKMALFWHGHFATNEEKVRDYRKMLQQVELFQREGLGNFRTLLTDVARGPAMLAFLDAGVNVKGAPNENFAREIMELFTLGVGHYGEADIREAARAFTGWNFRGLDYHFNAGQHDAGSKTVLGRTGPFGGEEVIDIILAEPAAAEFIAAKIYRYFVREDLAPADATRLGEQLRAVDYEIAPFLAQLFRSRDFYAPASIATRIRSPVELVISTYRKLGLTRVPGVPDLNETCEALGQRLLHPPTVAGWAYGRSWITPGLLLARGNFALDVLFPDINFIPHDRYPEYAAGDEIRTVHARIRAGLDISSATRPSAAEGGMETVAMSNASVDQDEDFNTRYASYRGWQKAIERVTPIPRHAARLDLASEVLARGLATPEAVVDYYVARFLAVPLDAVSRDALVSFLAEELGTRDITAAATYLEDPLRKLLHLILSRPEYQLG